MEGDLIYRDEELVGVTVLHASEIGRQVKVDKAAS